MASHNGRPIAEHNSNRILSSVFPRRPFHQTNRCSIRMQLPTLRRCPNHFRCFKNNQLRSTNRIWNLQNRWPHFGTQKTNTRTKTTFMQKEQWLLPHRWLGRVKMETKSKPAFLVLVEFIWNKKKGKNSSKMKIRAPRFAPQPCQHSCGHVGAEKNSRIRIWLLEMETNLFGSYNLIDSDKLATLTILSHIHSSL